jgi:hypothetical protein
MADLINLFSSLCGIAGFVFGILKYRGERRAQVILARKIAELDEARAHLKALEEYADGISAYKLGARA